MDWARWEKLAPLTGVVAVVLWVIGLLIAEADKPDDTVPQELLSWFQGHSGAILAGEFLFVLGVVFFIWFLGSLRARLLLAEGGLGRLTAIAYGSGLLAALGLILQAAPHAQGALEDEDLTAEAAHSLELMSNAAFGVVEFTLVPMFVAVGILTLRSRALPVWLGWISLAIALVLIIVFIGWLGVIFAFPIWTIIVSVMLYVKPLPPPGPPPHTMAFVGTEPGPPSA